MVAGQSYVHGKCLDCNTELPPLKDEHGWGIATCPSCGNKHDTQDYAKSGGIFLNNGICNCENCANK